MHLDASRAQPAIAVGIQVVFIEDPQGVAVWRTQGVGKGAGQHLIEVRHMVDRVVAQAEVTQLQVGLRHQ
ncbi:hypothetical protein D3C81_2166360 [compost metagenome]